MFYSTCIHCSGFQSFEINLVLDWRSKGSFKSSQFESSILEKYLSTARSPISSNLDGVHYKNHHKLNFLSPRSRITFEELYGNNGGN